MYRIEILDLEGKYHTYNLYYNMIFDLEFELPLR